MDNNILREQIYDFLELIAVEDRRFETNRLAVSFVLPLNEDTAGKNALVPSLLRRSCAAYPDFTRLNQKLDSLYGVRLYADVSKLGDAQLMTISAGFVDNRFALMGEDIAGECAELLLSMIFEPNLTDGCFAQEDVEQEKRELMEEIENEIVDKRSYARDRLKELMFQGQPYAVKRLGTKEQVAALTPQEVTDAYRAMLRTAQVKVILLGSADAAPIRESLKNRFAPYRGEVRADIPQSVKRFGGRVARFEDRMDVAQAKLVLGYDTGACESVRDSFVMKMMTALFGSTPHSRLFLNVREKLSLCYYCAAVFEKTKGLLMVDSGLEEQNCEKAMEEIARQLAFIQQGDFEQSELDSAIMSVCNSYVTATDSQGALQSYYLGALFDREFYTPLEAAEMMRGITKEEIVAAANRVRLDTVYLLGGKKQ